MVCDSILEEYNINVKDRSEIMCSRSSLYALLGELQHELRSIFGNKLDSVFLYGSYARGDYDDESDIDVMALIDIDKSELSKYRRRVSSFAGDIDLKYDVLLSVKLLDKQTFETYREVLPYYRNILNEGVKLSA